LESNGAVSPATASRQIVTRVTCTSSSAHPVKGIEPAIPVEPLAGVSNDPNGACDVPAVIEFSVTVIGPAPLPAPERFNVTVPACTWRRSQTPSKS
jgi:hypothetical protein